MRAQLQFKTKTGKYLFGLGITLALSSLLAAWVIFGLTFGTGFFMAVGNHIPANTPVENALYYNEVYEELSRR